MTKRDIDPDGGQDDASVKLEALRALIAAGVAAIERGDFTEVDDADLDAFLDSLVE